MIQAGCDMNNDTHITATWSLPPLLSLRLSKPYLYQSLSTTNQGGIIKNSIVQATVRNGNNFNATSMHYSLQTNPPHSMLKIPTIGQLPATQGTNWIPVTVHLTLSNSINTITGSISLSTASQQLSKPFPPYCEGNQSQMQSPHSSKSGVVAMPPKSMCRRRTVLIKIGCDSSWGISITANIDDPVNRINPITTSHCRRSQYHVRNLLQHLPPLPLLNQMELGKVF